MISDFELFRQLQTKVTNNDTLVTDLLRTGKQLASRLGLKEDLEWMNSELKGYEGRSAEEIPNYRHHYGVPEYEHPTDGWQEVPCKDLNLKKLLSHAVSNQPIGNIERMFKNQDMEYFRAECPKQLKDDLAKFFKSPIDTHIKLRDDQVYDILEAVKNKVDDFCLKVESLGLVKDKRDLVSKSDSNPATFNYIFNAPAVVGSIGNGNNQSDFDLINKPSETLYNRKILSFFKNLLRKLWKIITGWI